MRYFDRPDISEELIFIRLPKKNVIFVVIGGL